MNEKIEEMANDLEEEFVLCGTLSNCGTKRCSRCFSKYLYEQGYRKESDTAREILAEIDDLTLCIIDGSNEFEKGYFQAIADMKTAIKDLLKEKYGVDLGE